MKLDKIPSQFIKKSSLNFNYLLTQIAQISSKINLKSFALDFFSSLNLANFELSHAPSSAVLAFLPLELGKF